MNRRPASRENGETNSEWNRHWNTICMGILTIATAVVGAAFFAADIASVVFADKGTVYQFLQAAKVVTIVVVLATYLRMVTISGYAIFTTPGELERQRTSKRAQTAFVFRGLIIILFGLVALLVIDRFADLAGNV